MKKIAVIGNRNKDGVFESLERIRVWADQYNIQLESNLHDGNGTGSTPQDEFGPANTEELRQRFAGSDIAITLGGDGTLLYGVHIIAPLGLPVLSVNLGSLGFHTQVEREDIEASLDLIQAGNYRAESRLLLQAQLETPDSSIPAKHIALNDVVISKSAWGKMVHLRISVDDLPASDLFADGLIVCTPTGSSAYNYAADGPVLAPALDAVVINAICPHRMNFAPIVLSGGSSITVEFHPQKPLEEAQLLIDGRPWSTVSHEEKLKISRAPVYLALIVFRDDFYQKLRDKLRWGGLF